MWEFPWLILRFDNSLKLLTELRKLCTYDSEQPRGREAEGRGVGVEGVQSFQDLSGCTSPPHVKVIMNLEAPQTLLFKSFY